MNDDEIKENILVNKKCRKLVSMFGYSTLLNDELIATQKDINSEQTPLRIVHDVATRFVFIKYSRFN